jgi:hypothetical protein
MFDAGFSWLEVVPTASSPSAVSRACGGFVCPRAVARGLARRCGHGCNRRVGHVARHAGTVALLGLNPQLCSVVSMQRWGHSAATIGDSVVVFGGFNNVTEGGYLQDTHVLSGSTTPLPAADAALVTHRCGICFVAAARVSGTGAVT